MHVGRRAAIDVLLYKFRYFQKVNVKQIAGIRVKMARGQHIFQPANLLSCGLLSICYFFAN